MQVIGIIQEINRVEKTNKETGQPFTSLVLTIDNVKYYGSANKFNQHWCQGMNISFEYKNEGKFNKILYVSNSPKGETKQVSIAELEKRIIELERTVFNV